MLREPASRVTIPDSFLEADSSVSGAARTLSDLS